MCLAQLFEQCCHVLGQRRGKGEIFAAARMFEFEFGSVQGLARESSNALAQVVVQVFRHQGFVAIDRIADERMVNFRHVHADLVGASGFQLHAQEREFAEAFFDAVMRDGFLAVRAHCHFRAILVMAGHGQVDGVARSDIAVHEGKIGAMHLAVLQLLHQRRMRAQGTRDDHEAAGVLVEAVHDAGARQLPGFGEMVQEGVQHCAARVADSRMNDKPGGLVDYDDVFIGMNDIQGNGFRLRFRFYADADMTADAVARENMLFGFYRARIQENVAVLDRLLQAGARDFGKMLREILVKADILCVNRQINDGMKILLLCRSHK